MMELFENAGLISRNDLTFSMLMKSMGDRRFNSCTFLSEKEVDLQFESMFIFSEIKVLEKQVFISHSSMDKKEVEMIIPYLNRQDLPVWFDKYSIPVGTSITE